MPVNAITPTPSRLTRFALGTSPGTMPGMHARRKASRPGGLRGRPNLDRLMNFPAEAILTTRIGGEVVAVCHHGALSEITLPARREAALTRCPFRKFHPGWESHRDAESS